MFHNTFQSGAVSILSAYGSHPLQLWDIFLDQSSEPEYHGQIRRIRPNNDDNIQCSKEADTYTTVAAEDVSKVGGPFIELSGSRLSQNYIICPPKPKLSSRPTTTATAQRPSLGITLPYLYLTVHVPLQLDFSFEVTIMDDTQTIRRFRASTYQSTNNNTVIKPDICILPLKLERQHRLLTRDALLMPAKKKQRKKVGDPSDDDDPYTKNNGNASNDNSSKSYYGPGTSDNGSVGDNEEEEYHYKSDCDKTSCWNRLCIPLSEYTRRAYGTKYVETMWVQIHANCQLKRVYFAERKEVNEDDELPEEMRLYYRPS